MNSLTKPVVGHAPVRNNPTDVILPARPESLAINSGETALIVVDMQNAYSTKGGYLDLAGFDVSSTGPVIEQIARAIGACGRATTSDVLDAIAWLAGLPVDDVPPLEGEEAQRHLVQRGAVELFAAHKP